MAKNGILKFAAGFADGAMTEKLRQDRQAREDEDRARRNEATDIQLRSARRQEADQLALRQAAAPVEMQQGAGGALKPDTMDNRDVGQPGEAAPTAGGFRVAGKDYADQGQAEVALADANSPTARRERIASTLEGQGRTTEALQMRTAAEDYASRHWNNQIRDALPQGHDGLAGVMSSAEAGPFRGKKVKAIPSEDGKSVTYALVNADGSTTPTPYRFSNDQDGVIRAGYMLANVSPDVRYRNMVEADKAKFTQASKERELALREDMLNKVQIPRAEAAATLAEARAAAAEAKAAAGGSKVDSEDRKRWTTLHAEAGRRMDDTNKTLRQLQSDVVFMARAKVAGSPEAQRLAGLQDDLQAYKDDRALYGGLLAGEKGAQAKAEQGRGKAEDKPETKATSAGAIAQPQSKAEYDKLPAGAKYRHPNGDVRIKGGGTATVASNK